MNAYRCSELPLLFACAQSAASEVCAPADCQAGDVIAIDHDNEAARVGTAAHEMIRSCFVGDLTGDVAANICAANGVQQSDVWPLVSVAKRIVAELGLSAPDTMEDEIEEGLLSGHPDAEWVEDVGYVIGDWKLSRLDRNYFHQLMGYAWLRRERIRRLGGRCILFVAWLRDGTSERYQVTSDQIDEWYARLRNISAGQAHSSYTTGSHCTYCPRVSDCPAQREDMRQALVAIGDDFAALDVSKLDGATVAKVHRKLKLLANVKEKWDQAIKNRARAEGPIDLGDGYHLAVVTENGKREVDALKAWPAMTSRLTDEELAPCLRVSVTALESAVVKKAPPRKGAEHKRALASELEAAGAITQGTVEKLKEVRTQNLPETKEIAK